MIGARSQKESEVRKLTMVLSKEEERWRSVDLASHEPRHELTAATACGAGRARNNNKGSASDYFVASAAHSIIWIGADTC